MVVAAVDDPGPARDALVEPVDGTGVGVTDGLVDRVLSQVEGYPFLVQLWGAEPWEAARDAGVDVLSPELLDSIESDIHRRLDEEFSAGRVETSTPSEQDVLLGTAACPYPPVRSADIRTRSDKSEGNTAPEFHDHLQRRPAHGARCRG